MIEAQRQDMRFALRAIRRTPGVSAAIVVTLALGIGANVAMFSLTDRLFLRPPSGVIDPEHVRRLYVRSNWSVDGVTVIRAEVAYPAFAELVSAVASQARLAGYTKPDSLWMSDGNGTITLQGSYATANFMSLLGVRPALGRFYTADEDVMGRGAPVAVISHAFWERHFDADPRIIGRNVEIAHQRYAIIGVGAKGFTGTDLNATDVWLPLATYAAPPIGGKPWFYSWRSWFLVRVLARLEPGATDHWLSSVGTTVLRRGELAFVSRAIRPDTTATVLVGPLLESLGPSITTPPAGAISTRLAGATVIVLLIACANVVNLLLARAAARRREIAVRLALGISRRRLLAQLLSESVILSLMAGLAAVVVGVWTGSALRALVMPETHFAEPVLDLRVTVFAGTAALFTGIVVGLLPALQASRPDLASALSAGRREGGVSHSRLRAFFIVAQVALSVLLLHGAGLFVRSLESVKAIDLGYETSRLIYATVQFVNAEERYVETQAPNREVFSRGLAEAALRLERRPEVEETALASSAPMQGFAMAPIYLRSGMETPRLENRLPSIIWVSSSYFKTTGLLLVRGRFLSDEPGASATEIVVTEMTARTLWPGRDAIGECLKIQSATNPCRTVVGIVRDAHLMNVIEPPRIVVFSPLARADDGRVRNAAYLVIRSSPENTSLVAEAARHELRQIFPTAEPPSVVPLRVALEPQLRPWRLGATLFSAFGALALLVAAIGIYSVMSYSVTRRAHELSLRVALGARAEHLTRMILGQGMRAVLVGFALGIVIAVALGRFIASLLYGISTHDPVVMASVALLLLVVALGACVAPLTRALRSDPVAVLRAE